MAGRSVARGSGFDIRLLGDRELQRRLRALPGRLQRKHLTSAMRVAMDPVLRAARANAPRLTGLLARKIARRTIKLRGKGAGIAVRTPPRSALGIPRAAKGYYPAVQEYGSEHVAARPYMRPALENNRSRVLEILRVELGKRVLAELRA